MNTSQSSPASCQPFGAVVDVRDDVQPHRLARHQGHEQHQESQQHHDATAPPIMMAARCDRFPIEASNGGVVRRSSAASMASHSSASTGRARLVRGRLPVPGARLHRDTSGNRSGRRRRRGWDGGAAGRGGRRSRSRRGDRSQTQRTPLGARRHRRAATGTAVRRHAHHSPEPGARPRSISTLRAHTVRFHCRAWRRRSRSAVRRPRGESGRLRGWVPGDPTVGSARR